MASSDASASCRLSLNGSEEFDLVQLSFNPVAGVSPTIMVYDLPSLPPDPLVRCWGQSMMTSCLGDTLESDRSSIAMATDSPPKEEPLDLSSVSDDDEEIGANRLSITMETDADPCDPERRVASDPWDNPPPSLESSASLQSVTSGDPCHIAVRPRQEVYDPPSLLPDPLVRCWGRSTMTSCLGDTLESDRSSIGARPPQQVYDFPSLLPDPLVRYWGRSTMTSCLGDTLESDRSSVATATDSDTILKPLDLSDLSDDDEEIGAHRLSITMETDAAYLPADPCDPEQRVASVPWDNPSPSIEFSVSLQSVTSDASTDPRQAANEDGCSVSGSASSSLEEGLVDARCATLLEAYVERQRRRRRQVEILQADVYQAVRQRMAAVERVLADDLELRERLRNEERWSERKRHQRRLEGLPGWLRRLGLAIRGLMKRRPKERAPSCGLEEEEEEEDPELNELGRVARDVSRSQVLLERLREADGLARVRRAVAKDDRLQSQLTERLADVERTYSAYRERLDRIAREEAFDLANMRGILNPGSDSGLDDLEFDLKDNTCSEDMVGILRPGSGFRENLLLPPANWEFGPDDTARGPLDDKEEKRRRKEILKRKKPKKMGLKRRFFLCLRCLT